MFEFRELNDLRQALDSKQVSSVELTRDFLARVKKLEPELHSFITVTEEEALAQAREADKMISEPGGNPALCGIPYAAKDLFCTRGIRTTAGAKILDNYVPPYDATVIEKVKQQKAVLLGKTNLDQFAMGSSTETSAYGPSRNPWDTTRIPGGSSGGSAAAVAAAQAPWALGTDTGGSIRGPAALCGISGWKPTYGRVSRYGVMAMASSLDTIGALALSVRDLVMIAEVIAGRDLKDATSGHQDVPEFSRLLDGNIKGIKIGIPKEYFGEGIEQGVAQKVDEAIKEIQKLGGELVEVSLPNTKYGSPVYAIICPSEISSNLARYDGIRYGHVSPAATNLYEVYTKSRVEGLGDEAKRRIMTGTYVLSAGYYDAYYKQAQKVRRLIVNEFAEVFQTVDVLLAPSSPYVAPTIGKAADDPLFGYMADIVNIPASLAGLASICIPCGFAAPTEGQPQQGHAPSVDGLPVGLQIIGPQWGEQKIFNAGHAFQQATDWHKKHPALFENL